MYWGWPPGTRGGPWGTRGGPWGTGGGPGTQPTGCRLCANRRPGPQVPVALERSLEFGRPYCRPDSLFPWGEGTPPCVCTVTDPPPGRSLSALLFLFLCSGTALQFWVRLQPNAQPPLVTAQPLSVTAQPPSVTDQPPPVTAQPPSVTAQPSSVTAQPPSVTAQPPSV